MIRLSRIKSALGKNSVARFVCFGGASALAGGLAAGLILMLLGGPERTSTITGVGVNSSAKLVGRKAPEALEMTLNPVPIHKRDDYTVQPPDILRVRFTGSSPNSRDKEMTDAGGEHLVSPDGAIKVGEFGSLRVAGMTLAEIESAIESHMLAAGRDWRAEVHVSAQNSHVYYIIFEGGPRDDRLIRCPVRGDETVLDALAQVGKFNDLRKKRIWVARPQPGSHVDQVLQVNWKWTADQTATCTNHHLLPGDRIFVSNGFNLGTLLRGIFMDGIDIISFAPYFARKNPGPETEY